MTVYKVRCNVLYCHNNYCSCDIVRIVSASHLPLFTKCTLSVALYWLSMLSLCLLVSIVLLLDRNNDNTRQHLSQLAYNYHRY